MFWCVTVFLLALSVALWIKWRRSLFNVFTDLGIPGPKPSIFFGNVIEMAKKSPVPCQNDWVKKYGDVFGYYYGSLPTLVVSNPDLIKRILVKDFAKFTDRRNDFFASEVESPGNPINHNMVNMKGKKWKEMRSLVSPTFTSGKLKQMTPLLNESVSLMVSKLEQASVNGTKDVEMYSLYKGLTMDSIGKVALGIETSVQDNPSHPLMRISKLLLSAKFSSVIHVVLVSFREFAFVLRQIGILILHFYNKGSNPLDEMTTRLANVIKARKQNSSARRNDLLQTLIDARADSEDISDSRLTATTDNSDSEMKIDGHGRLFKNQIKLTDDQVVGNTFVFFIAGYETTSTTLAFLTHQLVNNIPVQDKIREEIFELFGNDEKLDYDRLMKMHHADRAIYETLRMNAPIFPFVIREASENVDLGKWTIPAGMTVQIPIYNLHYSPEHFQDPTKFDPDRFLPENRGKDHSVTWLPFGAGPRNCIGMRFALLEIKMALATMLRKFKLVPCGKTEMGNITLNYHFGIASPKNGIHLRAIPL